MKNNATRTIRSEEITIDVRICAALAVNRGGEMAENNIPYKVRAALLLVPLNTPMPTGAVTQSLWYIAVRSGDVHRVQHYLRTERDT